ncbi:uncharacterized protein MELLADRAFT_56630 [Melampsora larici-populina 98AG31]|uniref:Uncharacterized protein n=1 Tax=Melampsora larici-populina (strain 98AG31 / pathotype 3-4-7) TaxID=747676 RepID=F4RSL5_MELLP|nr:uncharacterized protein MELLADRAFT_56630 [Melampsora larici-populina 98AG31]EGG04671.1 hypothetical protein MELLADRAFT_56630 [Melampsora larici-populina 98AG31]
MSISNIQTDDPLPSNSPIHPRQHLATLQSHQHIITALAQLGELYTAYLFDSIKESEY